MYLNNLFQNEINGVSTDFRAEVVAAEMIENNTPIDQVLIIPLGAFSRPQNKDVEGIDEEVSEYDKKEYTLIKTHKEGLYDKLPEGLFHSPISYASDKTEQQVIEAIKRHRLEEKAARKFFLPFDVSLNNVRVQITLYENQLDKKFHFNQLVNIFAPYWEIFQFLDVTQANIFLQFLPIINRMRDDWRAIETFFEFIFSAPAKLKMRNQRKQIKTDEDSTVYCAVGQGTLGVDLTTGDYIEGGEFVEMVIAFGPLSAKQVSDFTGGAGQEKIVYLLCDYLLPADLDFVIEYELAKSDRVFCLPEKGEAANNCEMGVSSYL